MVHRVVLRGEVAFIDGEVLVAPGFGLNIREFPVKRAMLQQSSEKVSASLDGLDKDLLKPEMPKDHFDDELHVKIPTAGPAHLQPLSPIPPRTRLDSIGAQIYKEVLHNQHHTQDQSGRLTLPLGRSLAGKHILTVDMFHKEHLNDIFTLASVFKARIHKDRSLDEVLRGKVMASVFYEVSTRTSCSFAAAMQRLGGRVIYMDETSSSVKKGESLEDSIAVMAGYADVVVLRHPEPGAVGRVSNTCRKPILNAGDGIGKVDQKYSINIINEKLIYFFLGEHPTQALLDIFTIREEIGTVNGLTITMVGDLKHGRTVHSLARLLTLYNVNLNYVSPSNLGMPNRIIQFVESKGIKQNITTSLESVLAETDVLYMTRIQKERFPTEDEYQKACGHYVITPSVMTKAKRRMIVMHPLPRVFEISKQFDTDPRAAYFRQAEYGMYVRMSLLAMVLSKP
jgi:carbamoyl-phosphate synthase/aspartate carbamoyltransferase/dihydroorotase